MLFLLSYLNLPLFYLFKISGSKMDLESFLRYFYTKEKLAFSLIFLGFASYFPQHILYLRPLPHEVDFPILSILFIFIILFVFIVFQMKESAILFVLSVLFYIIYIYLLWTRRGLCPHPFT